MSCVLGHSWEVFSGDNVNCMDCDATGDVVVTYEPDEYEYDDEEGPL